MLTLQVAMMSLLWHFFSINRCVSFSKAFVAQSKKPTNESTKKRWKYQISTSECNIWTTLFENVTRDKTILLSFLNLDSLIFVRNIPNKYLPCCYNRRVKSFAQNNEFSGLWSGYFSTVISTLCTKMAQNECRNFWKLRKLFLCRILRHGPFSKIWK